MTSIAKPQTYDATTQADKEATQAKVESLLNGKNVNGGHCKFEEDRKQPGEVKKLKLNGPECGEILGLKQELAAQAETAPERVASLVALWDSWEQVNKDLKTYFFDSVDDLCAARDRGIEFVELYTAHYQQKEILTDYMHLLSAHGNWFWGIGVDEGGEPTHILGPPAWWSTTGLEKSHSMHKRKLRYKTMHGKPVQILRADGQIALISNTPHIYQLFQWQIRTYVWQWHDQKKVTYDAPYLLTLADLNDVWTVYHPEVTAEEPLDEAEIVYALCLAPGTKCYLIGRGKLAAEFSNVHVKVSLYTQAVVDVLRSRNGSVTGVRKRRNHAQICWDAEVKMAYNKRRREATKGRVDAVVEKEGLDIKLFDAPVDE
jgi:hypothetical protein